MTAAPSYFSYPLARSYPSIWFTYAIVGGGTLLAFLFTFAAVAANAFEPQSRTTPDLNGTESNKEWFQKASFSWGTITDTKCESAILSVGASYTTTNRGLLYSLSGIRQTSNNSGPQAVSSVEYRNNTLHACDVAEIYISLIREDETHRPRNFWTWSATTAQATTTCNMITANGTFQLDFLAKPPRKLPQSKVTDPFLNFGTANQNSQYGAQMMSGWLDTLSVAMGRSAPCDMDNGEYWGNSHVVFARNPNTSDYTSLNFFLATVNFPTSFGGLSSMTGPTDTIEDWATDYSSSRGFNLPNISTTVDAFGKSFYSLLLMDFNVFNSSNALVDEKGIRYLQSINDTDLARAAAGESHPNPDIGTITHQLLDDGPAMKPVDTTANSTAVFVQYLCSVAKQKSGGRLFFSVLLADLVFLSTCWTLFQWTVTSFILPRVSSRSNDCEGCLGLIDRCDKIVPLETNVATFGVRGHGLQQLIPMNDLDSDPTAMTDPLLRRFTVR